MNLFQNKNKSGSLSGKKIAILATDGFEESELFKPKEALEEEGAQVEIVSLQNGKIKAWKDGDWSKSIAVDVLVEKAQSESYDALMLPGGVMNPDRLRIDPRAIEFVKAFVKECKPIAAICHGPQILIETGMVSGKTMTS